MNLHEIILQLKSMNSNKRILQRHQKMKYHKEVSNENYAANKNEISSGNLIGVKQHEKRENS
jgi:hypothetical protein